MNSNDSKDSANQLIASNPEVNELLNQIVEEHQLFLSKFTHELRNPLTLVKSTIQLIEMQHPEVVDFKYWKQIMSDLDDTIALLNELSLYNHCDKYSPSDTDLSELTAECIENAKPLALQKDICIELNLGDGSLIYDNYSCDRIKMKQLITNLLKNSIEAAVEHSVIRLNLSIITEMQVSGHYITLSITDSGAPIAPEDMERIFEPFVTTKANGSGLGLAICRKIAELHHGSLSVSQTDDEVTFTLQLPTNAA